MLRFCASLFCFLTPQKSGVLAHNINRLYYRAALARVQTSEQ